MEPDNLKCTSIDDDYYKKLCESLSLKSIAFNNPLPSTLTGDKNTDRLVLNLVSDDDLLNVCSTNKYVYGLCQEDSFWMNRVSKKFGNILGTIEQIREKYLGNASWKEYYLWLMSIVLGDMELFNRFKNSLEKREDMVKIVDVIYKISKELASAAYEGNLNKVNQLLKSPFVNMKYEFLIGRFVVRFDPLSIAIVKDRTDIIKRLLQDPRVDPSINDNIPVRMAATRNSIDIVKLLMKDTRVDPSAKDNYALIVARSKQLKTMTDLLMTDPRVSYLDSLQSE